MTAPRTRIAEGTTDFEQDLLRSWEREQPSDAARQGALALVGVAAGLAASTTASTAAATGAKVATGSMAPKAASLGAAALGKWALVGAGLVALAVGGATVEYARSSSREAPAAVAMAAPLPGPVVAPSPSSPAAVPAPPATAPPAAASAVPPPPPLAALPAPSAPPASPTALEPAPPALGLGQQVAALDRARDALASGSAAGALRQIDDYDRQFPRGALAQEAAALRIEALFQQGSRAAAFLLADRFLASNPRSPHAARIRLLVERAHNP
jgi:hypothetical protein